MKEENNQCSKTVYNAKGWYSYPCSKKFYIERDGKMYCKIHDPEYIKAKDKKREEKYEKLKCKKCDYHFEGKSFYKFCPYCGTKK